MRNAERYPFTPADGTLGEASLRPYLPITLTHQGRSASAFGLLDTGSPVNVLPYQVGVELGALWEHQTPGLHLTGNLAHYEARALLVSAVIGRFAPVRLVFAWTQATKMPVYCSVKLISSWSSMPVSTVHNSPSRYIRKALLLEHTCYRRT